MAPWRRHSPPLTFTQPCGCSCLWGSSSHRAPAGRERPWIPPSCRSLRLRRRIASSTGHLCFAVQPGRASCAAQLVSNDLPLLGFSKTIPPSTYVPGVHSQPFPCHANVTRWGLRPRVASPSVCSVLVVPPDFDGLLHLDAAGLLHPAADRGIHHVSDGRNRSVRCDPAARAVPLVRTFAFLVIISILAVIAPQLRACPALRRGWSTRQPKLAPPGVDSSGLLVVVQPGSEDPGPPGLATRRRPPKRHWLYVQGALHPARCACSPPTEVGAALAARGARPDAPGHVPGCRPLLTREGHWRWLPDCAGGVDETGLSAPSHLGTVGSPLP